MILRRALIAMCGLLLVASTLFAALTQTIPWFEGTLALASASWLVVGAFLVDRRPRNAVGWLLMAFGVFAAIGMVGRGLGPATGRGVLVDVLRWYGVLSWVPMIALLPALLTVFPSGRPTLRWHWMSLWFAGGFALTATVWNGFTSEIAEALGGANPFLIEAVERNNDSIVLGVGGTLIVPSIVVAAIALVQRYRRARTVERLQIKWLLVPTAALLPALALNDVTRQSPGAMLALGVVVTAIPVVIGIAVTRYRLYDIDRIISRTVTYAIVVGGLGTLFAMGTVWLPQQLPTANNNLAVAASTLAVAALFNPLRRRVQRLVNRRFNRLPYDPESLAALWTDRLRDQMEPARVAAVFVESSVAVLEPMTASVWVRSAS